MPGDSLPSRVTTKSASMNCVALDAAALNPSRLSPDRSRVPPRIAMARKSASAESLFFKASLSMGEVSTTVASSSGYGEQTADGNPVAESPLARYGRSFHDVPTHPSQPKAEYGVATAISCPGRPARLKGPPDLGPQRIPGRALALIDHPTVDETRLARHRRGTIHRPGRLFANALLAIRKTTEGMQPTSFQPYGHRATAGVSASTSYGLGLRLSAATLAASPSTMDPVRAVAAGSTPTIR